MNKWHYIKFHEDKGCVIIHGYKNETTAKFHGKLIPELSKKQPHRAVEKLSEMYPNLTITMKKNSGKVSIIVRKKTHDEETEQA